MYLIPHNSNDLLNSFKTSFEDLFDSVYNKSVAKTMKTDIKEVDGNYELIIDIPGVNKEDIKVELKNGYLNISATSNKSVEEKDDDANYIRRERFSGSYSRSFYVGDELKTQDIKGKFENGTLTLSFPKVKEENQDTSVVID